MTQMTHDIVCCFDIENSATFQYSSLAIYCLELYEAYKETVACVISLIFIGAYVSVWCGDAVMINVLYWLETVETSPQSPRLQLVAVC